jgi:hypothetical protein
MVHWYLQQHPASVVYAFADNCVSQNKNNAMIEYFAWRVCQGLNRKISFNSLLTGHTRFGPDRMFGLIKMKYTRSNIDCFEDFVACVNELSVNHHNIAVRSTDVVWRNWHQFLKDSYAPLKGKVLSCSATLCTTSLHCVLGIVSLSVFSGITKYHHFEFNDDNKIICREFADTEDVVYQLWIADPPTTLPDVVPGCLWKERGTFTNRYVNQTIFPEMPTCQRGQSACVVNQREKKECSCPQCTCKDCTRQGSEHHQCTETTPSSNQATGSSHLCID